MKKWLIAVFDQEESYTYHIIDYINGKMNKNFIAIGFTQVNELLDYSKSSEIDILLIGDNVIKSALKDIGVKNVIKLCSDGQNYDNDQYPRVSKYQAVDKIVKEVLAYSIKEQELYGQGLNSTKEINVIGVYSPINSCGKTSLALALAHTFSHSGPTLYINTEEFSGLKGLLGFNNSSDLSDLFYIYKQSPNKLSSKMVSITQTIYNFDFIPPFRYNYDLRNIDVQEWRDFLSSIINNSNYTVIIIDLTNMIKDIFQFIEFCNVIYMPIKNDYLSQLKIQDFEEFVIYTHKEELLSKVIKLELPFAYLNHNSTDYLNQIMLGPITNFVKELISDKGK